MAAIAIAAAAVIVALFWPITDLIAAHDVGRITGPLRVLRLQMARDAARGRLLQLGAGLFAAAALVYTARNFTLSREGQVTDRYTSAVEQLGSKELDVKIGGIYALERIARDSARDYPTVMEVLATFTRQHSHEHWRTPGRATYDAMPETTRPDVQAAVKVIGRRGSRDDPPLIDLTGVKLPRVDLIKADLTGVNLADAELFRANLARANLARANLDQVDLTRANLADANLARASLFHADLTEADLSKADLRGADLITADLTDADLAGANLTGADLTDVLFAPTAAIPEGWERDFSSGRLKRTN